MSEQHDDHIWLTVNSEAWAIRAIEWPIIFLWRGYEPNLEYSAVEMSRFNAEAYADKAVAMLKDTPR
jgi:hypothetical protein